MLDPFTYWNRALASWQMQGTTARRVAETLGASSKVIDARVDTMRGALSAPWSADYAELSRMVTEKGTAFSASGEVMLRAGMAMQAAYWRWLQQSAQAMARGRMPTPGEAIAWWTRTANDALDAAEAGARTARDSLAPIHRTATANARRLGRRKR